MFLAYYLGLLHQSEVDLAEGFRKVADGHAAEADVYHVCSTLAKQCDAHAEHLGPFVDRATGSGGTRSPSASTTTSSTRPGAAASASCATCATCI